MKPFSLKEYQKHPDWSIVTRDGRPAEIIYTDRISERCVIALIGGMDALYYCANGRGNGIQGEDSVDDLFFLTDDHDDGDEILKALIKYFSDDSIAYNELCYITPGLTTDKVLDYLNEKLKK